MKAKYVFVLSVIFLAATLPGYSQGQPFWKQPESASIATMKINSVSIQIIQISMSMTIANAYASSNLSLAKSEAEKAEAKINQLASQAGNFSELQNALKEMAISIRQFMLALQMAEIDRARTIQRA